MTKIMFSLAVVNLTVIDLHGLTKVTLGNSFSGSCLIHFGDFFMHVSFNENYLCSNSGSLGRVLERMNF